METIKKILFVAFALLACYLQSPPLALVLGLVCAFTFGNPYLRQSEKATKYLLQLSVIGLGFGMNLQKVLQAGASGLGLTFLTIIGTLSVGLVLGRMMGLMPKISYLISAGTAICGGSAIAAVGPVLDADSHEMSVSLGTVFVLNSVALLLFPPLGHYLGLSQDQFGTWVAIAIHDTSSVVGAASKYGDAALELATTIKLARALWIVPVALFTSYYFSKKGQSTGKKKISFPLFILFFILASVLRTYIPFVAEHSGPLVEAAKTGLNLTLFLIGAALSLKALKAVGPRPLFHGIILWILISSVSLFAIEMIH